MGGGGAYKDAKNERITAENGNYPAKNILISIIATIFIVFSFFLKFSANAPESCVDAAGVDGNSFNLLITSSGFDLSSFKSNTGTGWVYSAYYGGVENCVKSEYAGFENKSVDLPITLLQDTVETEIKLKATFGGYDHYYDKNNYTMTGYNFDTIDFPIDNSPSVGHVYYMYITIIAISAISIDYKDAGGGEFSGTHTSEYSTNHTNGETTTLDTPTKPYYTFAGWYLNDPTCAESNKVTNLSADIDYATITLYAKWTPNVVTITLNCTNYSSAKPNYMIYLYKNDELVTQSVPTTQQIVLEISAIDIVNGDTYTFAFVYGYYGQLTVTSQDGITINNRKITITSPTDKTISYTLYTPLINSSIMI